MIIGVISDAHGNIYGLERCVSLLKRYNAERLFFLGDAINYFGKGGKVITFLKENNIPCIKGNHEITLLTNVDLTKKQKEMYGIDYTRATLQQEDYAYIQSWEDTIELTVHGLKILMVHANPLDYFWSYVYPDNSLEDFKNLPHDIIFIGHTHIPFVRKIDDKTIVNAGSVGLPRDDGRYISCALLNTNERKINILKVLFPHERLSDLEPFAPQVRDVLNRRAECTVEDAYEIR